MRLFSAAYLAGGLINFYHFYLLRKFHTEPTTEDLRQHKELMKKERAKSQKEDQEELELLKKIQ